MSLSVSLRHDFGSFDIDIGFEAPPGITVLFGRSGAGKSTVVKAVAGLFAPAFGHVALDGRVLLDTGRRLSLPPHRRRIGVVFQEGRLFPHMTVRKNLTYGRRFAPRGARIEDMGRIVEMLGIGPLLDRRPAALSGGEKQRVAIGRALLCAPDMILADEPLAALDEARKAEILPYFERLRDEIAVPVLYVSHSPAEVARLATTVVTLEGGRVARQGPAIAVLGDPGVTPLGAREAGAVLEAVVTAHTADGLTEAEAQGQLIVLPGRAGRVGARIRVRIAAQDVILATVAPVGLSSLNVLAGRVAAIRLGDGPGALVSVDTEAGRILSRITRRSVEAMGLTEGLPVHAIVKSVSIAPENVGLGLASG